MAVCSTTMPGACRAVIPSGCRPADDGQPATLSRRALFEAAGFVGLAGVAAISIATPDAGRPPLPPAGPLQGDPDLVRLARAHHETEVELSALIGRHARLYGIRLPASAYAEQAALLDLGHELADDMIDLPAATPAQLAAKASVIRAQLGYTGEPEAEDALLWSLTADLLRLAAP